jgi:hypothetical protein
VLLLCIPPCIENGRPPKSPPIPPGANGSLEGGGKRELTPNVGVGVFIGLGVQAPARNANKFDSRLVAPKSNGPILCPDRLPRNIAKS